MQEFYFIVWLKAKTNNSNSKINSPCPCTHFFNTSHSCYRHFVPILVTFIYLMHPFVCFAMSKIANVNVKRHRLYKYMHCVAFILIDAV